ncbi:glycosyl hydrolase family 1 domain-containing protein [Phthorimaea operculella]|nr:glycosyl hydrolase family 1 domain-containing protein [Phthorimaea operculella]
MWRFCALFLCTVAASAAAGRDFPPGFKFGAASASYQVEGAWNHSDKSENVWDHFSHNHPELIAGGATGDVACDSFNQWQTDVDLTAELGLHFYRFSLSWSRILPSGFPDRVSEEGTRYYNNLINGLLEKGVEPVVTIYHWDLPQRLQNMGGWFNPLIEQWFSDYARVVYELFGDRVKTWLTLNEPLVICDLSYSSGQLAPGILEPEMMNVCTKNLLLAHARAYRIYDEEFRSKYNGQVSLANHALWLEPESDSPKDAELTELLMQLQVGRYAQPIFGDGGWPAAVEKLVEDRSKRDGHPRSILPTFTEEEKEFIKGTFDFFALNHYTSRTVSPGPELPWTTTSPWPLGDKHDVPAKLGVRKEWPVAENAWLNINPAGLRNALVWLKERYGDIPIMITENGYASKGMTLDDQRRVDYYEGYLDAVLKAIKEDKVNVTGYTAWTLLDNFEWFDGYE